MSEDESKEFVDFWQKVKAVTAAPNLSDAERDLLHAGLFVAWILTARVSELESGFWGSFTADQVATLKRFGPDAAAVSVHFVPHFTPLAAQRSIQAATGDSIRSHTTP